MESETGTPRWPSTTLDSDMWVERAEGARPTHMSIASVVDGQKTVTLRNPWGEQEFGKDPRNAGVFTMPFEDWRAYFGYLVVLNEGVLA